MAHRPSVKLTQQDRIEFIKVWNSSTSVEEVSARLGISISSAAVRAAALRKNGVTVKMMRAKTSGTQGKVNWDELKSMARQSLNG